jgi:hypothetical protein
MNVEIIKRAQWLRPGGPRGRAAAGHIHHGGTRLPTILLAVLALVIAAVICAIRRSHGRRQAPQPDAWQQDQPPRSAAPASDVDMIFGRMANDAKRAVKQSEEEARNRRSDHIGIASEHLLLGIAAEPETVGARSLSLCGATPEIIIAAINQHVGVPGSEHQTGTVPITPSGTAVIEHAMRESAHLGHGYVGTGHLAMGCLTSCDGLAAKVLNNLGVTYNDLRQAVIELAPTNPPKFSSRRAHWEWRGS